MQSHARDATRATPCLNIISQGLDQPMPGWGQHLHDMLLLDRFEPIGLAQMDAVPLMDRIDTKYVVSLSQLPLLLAALVNDYWVLQVEGLRLNRYRTLYFDSESLDLYTSHHVGRSGRYKVRSRSYLDSGVSFLEVKRKTNKGRTIKDRIGTETLLIRLTPEANQFVDSLAPFDVHPLQPVLWNEFSRITLVSKCRCERVTIDANLRYWAGGSHISLGGLVVAEAKQEDVGRDSGLIAQMRALGVHPTPFSKYCVGMVMLYPWVKHNRFKPVLRQVVNVMRGNHHE